VKGRFTLKAIDGTARRLTRRARERLSALGFAPRPGADSEDRLRCLEHLEAAEREDPGRRKRGGS
jgi:hypothetical protein